MGACVLQTRAIACEAHPRMGFCCCRAAGDLHTVACSARLHVGYLLPLAGHTRACMRGEVGHAGAWEAGLHLGSARVSLCGRMG